MNDLTDTHTDSNTVPSRKPTTTETVSRPPNILALSARSHVRALPLASPPFTAPLFFSLFFLHAGQPPPQRIYNGPPDILALSARSHLHLLPLTHFRPLLLPPPLPSFMPASPLSTMRTLTATKIPYFLTPTFPCKICAYPPLLWPPPPPPPPCLPTPSPPRGLSGPR